MKIINIIIKDLKVLLTDKKAIGLMILMPIILTTILGSALKGSFISDENKSKIQIAIVKNYEHTSDVDKFVEFIESNSMIENMDIGDIRQIKDSVQEINIDRIFTEDFLENEEIKKIIDYDLVDEERAMNLLDKGEVAAVVILPEDFAFNMYMNFLMPFRNRVEINIIGHSDMYINSQIVEGIMQGFVDNVSSIIIGKNVFIETAMEHDIGLEVFSDMGKVIDELTECIDNSSVNIGSIQVEGREPISGFQYYAVGMMGMFVLFAAGNGGKLLLEEKDNQTYQRMVVSGTSKWLIVAGKFFTIFAFAGIQVLIMIAYSSIALGVKWGNPLLVILTSLCLVLAVAGLGIFIATIAFKSGNYKFADLFQSIIIHGMAVLGGSFMPLEVLPDVVQKLSNLTLNGIALKVYLWIMSGHGLEKIYLHLLGLIGMAILFSTISVYTLKKEARWKHVKHNKTQTYEIKG